MSLSCGYYYRISVLLIGLLLGAFTQCADANAHRHRKKHVGAMMKHNKGPRRHNTMKQSQVVANATTTASVPHRHYRSGKKARHRVYHAQNSSTTQLVLDAVDQNGLDPAAAATGSKMGGSKGFKGSKGVVSKSKTGCVVAPGLKGIKGSKGAPGK
jgi:hypothetical protein